MLAMMMVAFGLGHAAIPVLTPTVKMSQYLGSGVRVGGVADRDLTLLKVQWMRATNKPVERISIQLGEFDGTPLKGQMGYFHASYREQPGIRLSLDFARVQRAAVDEGAVHRAVAKSKLISKVYFTTDPEDGSTNLAFELRSKVQWDAFVQSDKGILVIDLIELGPVQKP
jgi:hypothetical protein